MEPLPEAESRRRARGQEGGGSASIPGAETLAWGCLGFGLLEGRGAGSDYIGTVCSGAWWNLALPAVELGYRCLSLSGCGGPLCREKSPSLASFPSPAPPVRSCCYAGSCRPEAAACQSWGTRRCRLETRLSLRKSQQAGTRGASVPALHPLGLFSQTLGPPPPLPSLRRFMTFWDLNGNFLTEGNRLILARFAPRSGEPPALVKRRGPASGSWRHPHSPPRARKDVQVLMGSPSDARMESRSPQAGVSRAEVPGPRLAATAAGSRGSAPSRAEDSPPRGPRARRGSCT